MASYRIKKGKINGNYFITVIYRDERITQPFILGVSRFFNYWNDNDNEGFLEEILRRHKQDLNRIGDD